MKRKFLFVLAALICTIGCQEEMESPKVDSVIGNPDSFYAEIEQSEDTKTYIDDFHNVRFQKGDQIAIFNNNTAALRYQVEDAADGETSGTFNKVEEAGGDSFVGGSDINAIVAYYPYTSLKLDATSVAEGNFVLKGITLPARQTYDAVHLVAQNSLPMLSAKTDNDRIIQFKNICGVLKLNIKGYGSIKQIAFSGNNKEKVSGKATISIKSKEMPLIEMDNAASTEVVLDCGEAGVALDPDTPKSFMIVLPPMKLDQGFKVTITDTKGVFIVKETTRSQVINRSRILNMEEAFTFGKKPDTPTPTPGETIPNNQIWYTTTDNAVITPKDVSARCFGADLTHNEYENGKGIMTFNGDVTTIGNIAFETCPTLSKIVLPSTIESIGSYAFDYCRSLTEVYTAAQVVPTGAEGMFNENIKIIAVPTGCEERYKAEGNWTVNASKIVGYDYSSALPVIYTRNVPARVHERGGSVSFDYFVLNSNLNTTAVEAVAEVPWIQNLVAKNGKVTFDVKANVGKPARDGIITLNHQGAVPAKVTIHHLCFQPSKIISIRGVDIPLIKVDGGTFAMGAMGQDTDASKDEKPAHQVTLSDYYIGQFEVTQELWKAVMGANPSYHYGDKAPVERITWEQVVNDFLPRLNMLTGEVFVLPTEAQWEFAARGGNESKGYKYSGSNNYKEVGWCGLRENNGYSISVGSLMPNELGIYDMSGNIAEYCSDKYDRYSAEDQIDPIGGVWGKHVVRNGGYESYPQNCRVTMRSASSPDYASKYEGFRLAISNILTLNRASLELVEGQSEIVQVLVNNIISMKSGLTWSSSNPGVASVGPDGKVTALMAGSSVITVRAETNSKELSLVVHVTAPVKTVMTVTANGVDIPLIKVDGGSFTMGATPEESDDAADDEKPAHQVTLSDYYIGQYEVTQELWEAVMGSNPSEHKGDLNYPVESVSWNQIVNEFLPKLNKLTGRNFTLPTEAQWEYAARGGNKSEGYKYSGSNNVEKVGWYRENATSQATEPVGHRAPNELGIFDMTGNVEEMCSDWYGPFSSVAQINPKGPSSGSYRVTRGGCCFSYRHEIRLAYRQYIPLDSKIWFSGFRLALVP